MHAYQTRVINEAADLETRKTALENFIKTTQFNTLADEDRALLRIQVNAMSTYLTVLKARIARF